jgi:hypothetical protein
MYIKNISASSVVKTVICEVDSLIANTSASFGHNRIEEVGTPTSDDDAATKKYVDDTDAATRTVMNSRVSYVESSVQFQLLPSINSPIVTHVTAEVVNNGSYGTVRLRNMETIVPTIAAPLDVSPGNTL